MSFLDFTGPQYRIERFSAALILSRAVQEMFPRAEVLDVEVGDCDAFCRVRLPHHLDSEALTLLEERLRLAVSEDLRFEVMDMMAENAAQMLRHEGNYALAERLRPYKGGLISLVRLGSFTELAWEPPLESTGALGELRIVQVQDCSDEELDPKKPIHQITIACFPDKRTMKEFVKARREAAKKDPVRMAESMDWGRTVELTLGNKIWTWQNQGLAQLQQVKRFLFNKAEAFGARELATPCVGARDALGSAQVMRNLELQLVSKAPVHALMGSAREPVAYFEWSELELAGRYGLSRQGSSYHGELTLVGPMADLDKMLSSLLQLIVEISKILNLEYQVALEARRHECRVPRNQWQRLSAACNASVAQLGCELVTLELGGDFPLLGPELRFFMRDRLGCYWDGPRLRVLAGLKNREVGAVSASLLGPVDSLLAYLLSRDGAELPEQLCERP